MEIGLVSCIVPTYKRSETLINAIKSILSQTYKNLEVLIVDDNEPNDRNSLVVQQKIKNISDPRVRYIQQERHINGAAARNSGIKAARGEYIAFLDDDDQWLPTKIERQVSHLKANMAVDGVSTLYTHYLNSKPVKVYPRYSTEELHRKILGREVAVYTSTVLVKRLSLDKSGYFDETLARHQDLQLLLDFLLEHKFELIPEHLVIINSDLVENRANLNTIVGIKENFFKVAKKHFDCYDRKTQRVLFAAHYFEIMYVALKNRNMRLFFKYWFKIGLNVDAYTNVYKRYIIRKT